MGIEEVPALRLAFLFHRKHLQHNTKSGDTRQRGMFQRKDKREATASVSPPMRLFTRNPALEPSGVDSATGKRMLC